jgi:hypothetical protein
MKKSIAGVTVAASVLAGGMGGLVLTTPGLAGAQEDEATTTDDERPDVVGDVFADLVEEGVLTQEQADTVKERLHEAREEFGPRAHGPRAEHREILTDVLGVTDDELKEARDNGDSLADVAAANGVETQAVIDALIVDLDEHLDNAVEAERLTQAEADERLTEGTERITDMVNGDLEPGERGFGPRGQGGPGGPGGPPEDAPTDEEI